MSKLAQLYHPIVWYKCKTCRCDSLYRTVTKFSCLLF